MMHGTAFWRTAQRVRALGLPTSPWRINLDMPSNPAGPLYSAPPNRSSLPSLSSNDTDPFFAAVAATPMPMAITDSRSSDNPIVYVNDAFCQLTGYSRDEVIGRNCRFLQGPGTDGEALETIRQAVSTHAKAEADLRNYRKDGTAFWNRLRIGPVPGPDGEVVYFYSSQMDVTLEREQLWELQRVNVVLTSELADRTAAVKTVEARLLAAADSGNLGLWQLDLRTLDLVASGHCKANFGRSVNEPFTYLDLQSAVHVDDQQRMQAAVKEAIAKGSEYRIEYRIQRPDGGLGWVRILGRLELDAQGKPSYMAGISQDITEEMLLRQRTELLETLDRDVFGTIEDPAQIAFAASWALGRVLDVSRAGYGVVDPQTETITIGRDWNAQGISTLSGTLQFRDFGSYIDNLKRGETVIVSDARLDGRTVATADALASIDAQALINVPVHENGALVALLYLTHATARTWTPEETGLVREVAHRIRQAVERRRAERQLRDLAASLEEQVRERTQALQASEAALRQSQKMEAVGQLTSGIAHDFNNLLAAISGSFEMLQRRLPKHKDVLRLVDIGRAASKRAAALTHRLLAFSRLQPLDPTMVRVNQLISGFQDLVRRTIGPQIALRVEAEADLWLVQADHAQLENALLNLCINARDAMPDGGLLTIRTFNCNIDAADAQAHGGEPGAYACVCVTDSGVGMPPDVIERAFDPFFTTKPVGVGTGLGLSMVYGFARQSGGRVRIESNVGAGTSVYLYLPRHDGEAGPETAAAGGIATTAPAATGETILVVDDEAAIRSLMVEVLEEIGYRVLQAADGPSALAALEADPSVVLLITDVGLPGGLNGRQVADRARALRPNLKILVVTGYAERAVLEHGQLRAEMQVLTKPFDLGIFCQMVQSLVCSAPG
ncbi:PAS domain-containing protein [Pseudorhodoferax sp. Leaf267]|uniref:PAS domain-containing protein n=1 Tax=Pseudorhodoferax sp. Leaf267 TaxID=1736316 RepID=UPI000AFB09D9|nr:PAS domain-containing protein [Pseudorhodoferax sp. Leaf267]